MRLAPLKRRQFSQEACRSGMYRGARREFCLYEDFSAENVETGIRDAALAYFKDRGIGWHDSKGNGPSNHLCCSQTCCVNFWFPFIQAPNELGAVLRGLGYDVAEMLPLYGDQPLPDGSLPFVAFEWIGKRNYLGERRRGKVAADEDRTRGASFTSLDFCVRFRRSDGRIQLVAGEWKYTERYGKDSDLRYSRAGTDRLCIYREHLERPDCQVAGNVSFESLFFDPFYQLMRQQLLCTAMERCGEMEAEIVSLLHTATAGEQGVDDTRDIDGTGGHRFRHPRHLGCAGTPRSFQRCGHRGPASVGARECARITERGIPAIALRRNGVSVSRWTCWFRGSL